MKKKKTNKNLLIKINKFLLANLKKLNKWEILLIIAVSLGTFLRFYKLEANIIFHGELGHNYLAIKNIIASKKIPLLGPPTSHPWLSFGPLFYWIMAPIMKLAKFDPKAGAYFFAFIGSIIMILNYEIIYKLFKQKVAVLSTLLIAISPLWIATTRESRFFSLVVVFFYPFLYFLIDSLNKISNPKHKTKVWKPVFLSGIFLGLMLNFHWTPLALLPPITLLLYWNKKRLSKTIIFSGIVGLLIPNIPFITSAFFNKFTMLAKLTTWFPYRVAGFIGLYPKNTVSSEIIKNNIISFYDFFRKNLLSDTKYLLLIIVIATVSFIFIKSISEFRKKKKDWAFITITSLLIGLYIGLFIHGDPPVHYYVPIFPLPIIFFSFLLEKIQRNKALSRLSILLLLIITFVNLNYFYQGNWFNSTANWFSKKELVPYKLQLLAAKKILKTAGGEKFQLRRVGPFDHFEGQYAQNYQYLLWWMGNEPVTKANLIYTIYEKPSQMPAYHKGKVYWIENLAILREEVDFEKIEKLWKQSLQ